MKNLIKPIIFLLVLTFAKGCTAPTKETMQSSMKVSQFGTMPDGTVVEEYTLTNKNGVEMKVITYGGIITSLKTPDKEGKLEDIVLGYDNLESYLKMNPYFGAIIGRYGNRIAKGKFTLDSVEYQLAVNNIGNHLHGGLLGFDKVVWKAKEVKVTDGVAIEFSRVSPDMEEGYPGSLDTKVLYTLGDDNSLRFDYEATTDKPTIVNLTQHTYFNLSAMKEDILGHQLTLFATRYLPVDSTLIPTGELAPVAGTPFDFTQPKAIGVDIGAAHEQLAIGGGYDHNWVLDSANGNEQLAAKLYHAASGRYMEVYTTEPGIQFYSGNFLDKTVIGKNGVVCDFRTGLCLETQHYPDSPNQPAFPSVELRPGQKYQTSTTYRFGVK